MQWPPNYVIQWRNAHFHCFDRRFNAQCAVSNNFHCNHSLMVCDDDLFQIHLLKKTLELKVFCRLDYLFRTVISRCHACEKKHWIVLVDSFILNNILCLCLNLKYWKMRLDKFEVIIAECMKESSTKHRSSWQVQFIQILYDPQIIIDQKFTLNAIKAE